VRQVGRHDQNGGVTGEGVQQHYALQERWQRLFASRARQWATLAGKADADASREVVDRAVSEALQERGVLRGASPSSVKKWRTGRFAPPPADVLVVLERVLGTGTELADLLASITPDVPANGADDVPGNEADATSDGASEPPEQGDGPSIADHDPGASATGAYPGAASPRRNLRRRALAAAAVVAVIVLVGGALLVNRRSSGEVEAGRKNAQAPCPVAVGSLPDELSSRSSAAKWKEAFATAYREAGGRAKVRCPIAPVERVDDELLVQTLPGPVDAAPSALVVIADEPAFSFYFHAALWTSYQDIDVSAKGLPTSIVPAEDGHVEVELDSRMLLVAERVDAPYFYIPPRYVNWWRANQEAVGLPMGNPLIGAGQQDTEHGFATASRNAPNTDPVMHPVAPATAEAELPAEVEQGEVILSEADGTDWWVPSDGRRQWIADLGTWTCLGGNAKVVGNQVSGAAVATLEYDGIAVCED
jgi:hypothetical protein